MNPAGWTAADEMGYQQELANLKARIAAAGPSDDIAIVIAEYDAMLDPNTGRQTYLKVKRNNWP